MSRDSHVNILVPRWTPPIAGRHLWARYGVPIAVFRTLKSTMTYFPTFLEMTLFSMDDNWINLYCDRLTYYFLMYYTLRDE